MDACCERIAGSLCQSGQPTPRNLAKLVEKADLARSTVMLHLNHLESRTLVVKEEILQGSVERPKTLYKPSSRLLEQNIQTESD